MSKDNTTEKKLPENKRLTAKQQAFVDFYTDATNDATYSNGTASAKAAGYKGDSATLRVIASQNLIKLNIKSAIAAKVAVRQEKMEYDYNQAVWEIDTYIAYLEGQAAKGNVSAVTAITSLLREKNDIAGLHKQRFVDESEQRRQLTESEEQEARRLASIRLRTG